MKDQQTTLTYSIQTIEINPERAASTVSNMAKPTGDYIYASGSPNSNGAKRGLNWVRILKYTALVLVVSFFVGLFFGSVRGYLAASGRPVPQWLEAVQAIAMTVSVGFILVLFSYRQHEQLLLNVLVLTLAGVLLTLPNAFLVGLSFAIGSCVHFVILSLVCVPIGLNARVRKEIAELKVPLGRSTT